MLQVKTTDDGSLTLISDDANAENGFVQDVFQENELLGELDWWDSHAVDDSGLLTVTFGSERFDLKAILDALDCQFWFPVSEAEIDAANIALDFQEPYQPGAPKPKK